MEQYYDFLRKAYIAECGEENIKPETEENLLAFEEQFVPIPKEYRWLLGRLGGCHLVDPWIFTLNQLRDEYPNFIANYKEYSGEETYIKAFPIGGLGDGSIVFFDIETGAIKGYNADYEDIEDISESFSALMIDITKQYKEMLETMTG